MAKKTKIDWNEFWFRVEAWWFRRSDCFQINFIRAGLVGLIAAAVAALMLGWRVL